VFSAAMVAGSPAVGSGMFKRSMLFGGRRNSTRPPGVELAGPVLLGGTVGGRGRQLGLLDLEDRTQTSK